MTPPKDTQSSQPHHGGHGRGSGRGKHSEPQGVCGPEPPRHLTVPGAWSLSHTQTLPVRLWAASLGCHAPISALSSCPRQSPTVPFTHRNCTAPGRVSTATCFALGSAGFPSPTEAGQAGFPRLSHDKALPQSPFVSAGSLLRHYPTRPSRERQKKPHRDAFGVLGQQQIPVVSSPPQHPCSQRSAAQLASPPRLV